MGALTVYLGDAILNHVQRGSALAAPVTLYVGLSTTATTQAGAYTEPAGGSYSRVGITCATGSWSAPALDTSFRRVSNANPVSFPTSSASWGTLTHFIIADAATAGNVLFQGALVSSVVIGSGQAYTMAAGQIKPGLYGSMTDYLADALLNHIFRAVPFSAPANTYAGLSTTATTRAGGYTEPAVGSYARKAIACNTGNWDAPANASGTRKTANTASQSFVTATANWPSCSDGFVADSASGGNVLWFGALNSPVTISSGSSLVYNAGQLSISVI